MTANREMAPWIAAISLVFREASRFVETDWRQVE
jgi:hypothetical protein